MSGETLNDPTGLLTFAIGDIHGCLHKLVPLLDRCLDFSRGRPMRFVFLGDYVDRGPDSRGVIHLLRAMEKDSDAEVICLRGNHEVLMLAAVRGEDNNLLWLMNGASATLESYGIGDPRDVPPEEVEWLDTTRFSYDDGRRYFVHAGVNPALPLDRQIERDQVWIREPFLSSVQDYGRLIVHGHTPLSAGVPDLRANRLNIDTAAVVGGPLTAAVFDEEQTGPIAFLTELEERPA